MVTPRSRSAPPRLSATIKNGATIESIGEVVRSLVHMLERVEGYGADIPRGSVIFPSPV